MVDIVFASVPYTYTQEPMMAPAVLKAIAAQQGYKSVALDLNIEIVNLLKGHSKQEEIINFFSAATEMPDLCNDIVQLIEFSTERILSYSPKIIGLSLLTYNSQLFTLWLLIKLKSVAPDIKIIIGGPGIKNFVATNDNSFCEKMKSLELIDHYITGDGQDSLKEFLGGNLTFPGIDSPNWTQPTDLDQYPYPDYSDYDFSKYDKKGLPITDSQGCVRACEFCDIIEHWKKYVYRSAESVFAEMLNQIQQYDIRVFIFRNSLTNGNMKEFKKLLDLISDYNKVRDRDLQIKWDGYFIIREKNQHPEVIFQKIRESNGTLALGVESVIAHVRREMGKNFSNESIDYHLEMAQKYQIPLILLLMVGNPTETLQDYEFTKQWFTDRYHYARNSVKLVNLSLSSILPGTEWSRKKDELNVKVGKYPSIWINQYLNITNEQRLEYWNELVEICAVYNNNSNTVSYPVDHQEDNSTMLKDLCQNAAVTVVNTHGSDL